MCPKFNIFVTAVIDLEWVQSRSYCNGNNRNAARFREIVATILNDVIRVRRQQIDLDAGVMEKKQGYINLRNTPATFLDIT